MIDGVAVGHCGAFWTCKSTAVRHSCASFGKKRSLQNLIFGAVKHWPWTPRSGPPQLRWKIDGQTIPNFDPLASCEDLFVWKFGERMYSVLNHLEPTWTSLNLSWNNVCAGEQLGNHFKFVGTDLWTREPIGTYRNQVGTNLEPNGTSLCMEELGDGFWFVFVVCGVFGCCLTHALGTWCCDCIG